MSEAPPARRAQLVMAVVVVASAVLLVIGVAAERSQGDPHDETPAVTHDEPAEGSEAHERVEVSEREEAERTEAGETSAQHAAETNESLFGMDAEPIAAVVAAVLGSVLLAGGVLWRPNRELIAAAVVFTVLAAVIDVTEVAHQLDDNRTGITVIAALVLVLHAGAALAGGFALSA